MRRYITAALLLLAVSAAAPAQDSFRDSFEKFKSESSQKHADFRKECNDKYAEFLRKAWEDFKAKPVIKAPEKNPLPPVVYDPDTPKPQTPVRTPDVEIVPVPVLEPQPTPSVPIITRPPSRTESFEFTYFGTGLKLPVSDGLRFHLRSMYPDDVADGWTTLSSGRYDSLLSECLKLREEYKLCDWAYLMMLVSFTDQYLRSDNEAILLTAYLYSQSGYKMRLGLSKEGLTMLFGSDYTFFGIPYYEIGGDLFYQLNRKDTELQLVDWPFPDEKGMSLRMDHEPLLAASSSDSRKLTSKKGVSLSSSVNQNMVKFFSLYPTAQLGDNPMTRWAIYADTPLDESVKERVYEPLKAAIAGKDAVAGADILLNFVQTAFEYKLDDEVWGRDRAFFGEETLYYPYSDCEDRSILFSHLVRDLLGLDVVLVYYPNHLATAVRFPDGAHGDSFTVEGGAYTVCDPTYINAPVGASMPEVAGQQAMVIKLRR